MGLYAVGIGLGTDDDFMDRLARAARKADASGLGPHTSGNPALYEQMLTDIFDSIIRDTRVRLVR